MDALGARKIGPNQRWRGCPLTTKSLAGSGFRRFYLIQNCLVCLRRMAPVTQPLAPSRRESYRLAPPVQDRGQWNSPETQLQAGIAAPCSNSRSRCTVPRLPASSGRFALSFPHDIPIAELLGCFRLTPRRLPPGTRPGAPLDGAEDSPNTSAPAHEPPPGGNGARPCVPCREARPSRPRHSG